MGSKILYLSLESFKQKVKRMEQKRKAFIVILMLLSVLAIGSPLRAAEMKPGPEMLDRSVLPIPEPQYPHSTVLDVRNATPPPRFEVHRQD
jgi:hypothetical protein